MNSIKLKSLDGDRLSLECVTGIAKWVDYILVVSQGVIYLIDPDGVVSCLKELEHIYFSGIAVSKGGVVYACDYTRIFVITIEYTHAGILAGSSNSGYKDGKGRETLFNRVMGICVGSDGNILAADSGNIRKITPEGMVSTFAGDGPTLDMQSTFPHSVCICDDTVYIHDAESSIVKIHKGKSTGTTIDFPLHRITVCLGRLFALSTYDIIYQGFPPCVFQGDGIVGFKEFLGGRRYICAILGDGDTLYILGLHHLWAFNLAPVWSTQTHRASSTEFKNQVKTLMMIWTRRMGVLGWIPAEIMFLVFGKLHCFHISMDNKH